MTVSIAIVAHTPVASALKQCVLHIFGGDERIDRGMTAFDVDPSTDSDAIIRSIESKLPEKDAETLILTDISGATPCNLCCHLLSRPNTRLISGVNVAMIIAALDRRNDSLALAAQAALDAGNDSIREISPHT